MGQTAKKFAVKSGHGQNNRFISLSTSISRLAAQENLEIVPFFDEKLPYFSALCEGDQNHVLWQLEVLEKICLELQTQGSNIRSAKALTWAFLKHMRYTVPSDLLGHLQETDFVDAYNKNHQMIFACIRFFQVLSYSLEDFYCRPWMTLFSRDRASVHDMLFKLSDEMLNGVHRGIVMTDYIPTHVNSEINSPKKLRGVVRPRLFSPIYDHGEIAGYLCVNQAALL